MRASAIYFAGYFAITSRALSGRHTHVDLGKRRPEAIKFVSSITSWVGARNRSHAGALARVLGTTQTLMVIYRDVRLPLRMASPAGKPWKLSKKRSNPAQGHVCPGHGITAGSSMRRSNPEVMREVKRERPSAPAHRRLRVASNQARRTP